MRSKLWTLKFALVATVLCACDGQEKSPHADDAAPTPSEAGVQAEQKALAQGVLIRVALDDKGQEVKDSAAMRLTDHSPEDGAAAADAFAQGLAPKVLGSGSELDADQSTASWQDYRGQKDYKNYQPRVYAKGGAGGFFSYIASAVTSFGKFRYYHYQKSQGYHAPKDQGGAYGQPVSPAGLRQTLAAQGIRPLHKDEFLQGDAATYELGSMLFYDPLLSGNHNTACATCHVDAQGTSNAMSLGPTLQAREAGKGRGSYKVSDLLPRNAPSLYNRGHSSYKTMFWDSRVAAYDGYFKSPAGDALPSGLNSALAAQALFPLAAKDEMLGCLGQNELAAHSGDYAAIWSGVVDRVIAVPKYVQLLQAAYPQISPKDIGIEHLANAIAIYESMTWWTLNSPFDRYLAGDDAALSPLAKRGAEYFYGEARCYTCHAGALQTDQGHHAIGMPQFGPGTDENGSLRDIGWGKTTGNAYDNYKFKTPSLRNVSLSGPWGHDGAYSSLTGIVRHYRDPAKALASWDWQQVIMPFPVQDPKLMASYQNDSKEVASAIEIQGVPLDDAIVDAIVAFLESLTDYNKGSQAYQAIPQRVPSGYPLPKPWYPEGKGYEQASTRVTAPTPLPAPSPYSSKVPTATSGKAAGKGY